MKHVVLYSGGHASALTAVEAVRKFGKEDVILLNHDISEKVEHIVSISNGLRGRWQIILGLRSLMPMRKALKS